MGTSIDTNSFYYNAAFEASRLESKKVKKESEKEKLSGANGSKAEKNSFFSNILKTRMEKTDENSTEVQGLNSQGLPYDIPEIQGMSFEKAEEFLIDSVYSSGDLLKQSPVPENFAKYKKSIQNFLKFVQSQSYEVEEIKGIVRKVKEKGRLKPISKQKSYTLIKVVNEKLDSLASDILYNQREQIKMAAKIDDIKGLLVDVLW